MMGLGIVLLLLLAAMAGLFLLSADFGRSIDFKEPLLTGRPNQYLVCPKDFCADTPNEIAPVFDVPADKLLSAVDEIMSSERRLTSVVQSDPKRRSYVQRSKLFRFPDRITLQAVSPGDGKSSVAIYSQSKFGYRDAGVNAARVKRLLAGLKEAVK